MEELASPELVLSLPKDTNSSHVGVRTPQNKFNILPGGNGRYLLVNQTRLTNFKKTPPIKLSLIGGVTNYSFIMSTVSYPRLCQ
jgi:hypothetical protein